MPNFDDYMGWRDDGEKPRRRKRVRKPRRDSDDGVREPVWTPCVTPIGTDHDGVEFD